MFMDFKNVHELLMNFKNDLEFKKNTYWRIKNKKKKKKENNWWEKKQEKPSGTTPKPEIRFRNLPKPWWTLSLCPMACYIERTLCLLGRGPPQVGDALQVHRDIAVRDK